MSRKATGASLLKVDHVTVRFGGLTALDDVSFKVHEGDLLGLIGPNGAGKTTMMRSIVGVVQTTSGSVSLDGESLASRSASTGCWPSLLNYAVCARRWRNCAAFYATSRDDTVARSTFANRPTVILTGIPCSKQAAVQCLSGRVS